MMRGQLQEALGEYRRLVNLSSKMRGKRGVGGAVFALEKMAIVLEGMGEPEKATAHRARAEELEGDIMMEYKSDDEAQSQARRGAWGRGLEWDGAEDEDGGEAAGMETAKSKACVIS